MVVYTKGKEQKLELYLNNFGFSLYNEFVLH